MLTHAENIIIIPLLAMYYTWTEVRELVPA